MNEERIEALAALLFEYCSVLEVEAAMLAASIDAAIEDTNKPCTADDPSLATAMTRFSVAFRMLIDALEGDRDAEN